jgi:hypothetical protein
MKERDALRQAIQSNPKRAAELMKMVTPGPPSPDEPISVLCMPWPGLVDDSVKQLCVRCGIELAVAPSTQEMAAQHRAEIHYICVECSLAPVH